MKLSSPAESPQQGHEDLDVQEACALEQAVEKLVLYGWKVGVTPEEMISLLDSGISIRELLIFLAAKTSGAT